MTLFNIKQDSWHSSRYGCPQNISQYKIGLMTFPRVRLGSWHLLRKGFTHDICSGKVLLVTFAKVRFYSWHSPRWGRVHEIHECDLSSKVIFAIVMPVWWQSQRWGSVRACLMTFIVVISVQNVSQGEARLMSFPKARQCSWHSAR